MISSLLALTLLASAAQPQDPTVPLRQNYMRCLDGFMRASLQQRMEPPAFEAALAQQCGEPIASYRSAMMRRERTPSNRVRAEEDIRLDLEDTKVNLLERYRMYFESNSAPRPN